jgi:3',5'-cyclic-AMP phosphodiesterase
MLIAQLSDVHVGGGRYREQLLRAAIEEINAADPDLVVVAGDLTDEGYPDQYPLARQELAELACRQVVRVPGNHDARNVGYLHYEDTFGARLARAARLRRAFRGACRRRLLQARSGRGRDRP